MSNLGPLRVIFNDPVRSVVHVAHLVLYRFVELLDLYVVIVIDRFHAVKADWHFRNGTIAWTPLHTL
jgi:hypothetical protein